MTGTVQPPGDPHGDQRPRSLSSASRALYKRAIEDRTSLTEAERRQVLNRPSQDEENELCRQQTGLTYDEIVGKALGNPDALTHGECHILTRGVQTRALQSFDKIQAIRELPPDQRQLVEAARTAVTTERERSAHDAAVPVFSRLKETTSAARAALSSDDRRNLTKANLVPWLEHVLGTDSPPAWGFILLRCDFTNDTLWQRYREAVDNAVRTSLAAKASVGRIEEAGAKFTIFDIEAPVTFRAHRGDLVTCWVWSGRTTMINDA